MNRTLFIIVIFTLFFASPVLASIDLVSPENGAITNDQDVTFEFYPSMQGIERCVLNVSGEQFIDVTIDNEEFNTFTVVNIDQGVHTWSVRCENGTRSEQSGTRNLIIDWNAPQLQIIEPTASATVQTSTLKVTVTDDHSSELICTAYNGATQLASFTATDGTLETINLGLTQPGEYTITVTCLDEATNAAVKQQTFTLEEQTPELFLDLSLNKPLYSLGEVVALTINTLNEAIVSIEVCPDEQGFVQCFTPLIDSGFPQTVVLPYTKSAGAYIIDATASLDGQIVHDITGYTVKNTMTVTIEPDIEPAYNHDITFKAEANGAVGAVSYVWKTSDGRTINDSDFDITYTLAGTYTEKVTATDANGNTATEEYVSEIEFIYDVEVQVKDAVTNAFLSGAIVQFENVKDQSTTVDSDAAGKARFSLEKGIYDLFVSKTGYEYGLQEIKIDKNQTIVVSLKPSGQQAPIVTIVSPEQDATTGIPTIISFSVKHDQETKCQLSYAETGAAWLEQAGTVTVAANSEGAFDLTALEEKPYTFMIGCTDSAGNLGESEQHSFTVNRAVEEQAITAGWSDDALAVIDRAYGAYDSFTVEQRMLADLLGWEDIVKQRKRDIERSMRDRDAVKFRRDLDENGKMRETKTYDEKILKTQSEIPIDLAIIESKKRLENLNEDDIAAIVEGIIESKDYTLTTEQAQEWLNELQQGFTKETTVYRAKMLMADGKERDMSLITDTFTYANPDALEDHALYEIVPKQMAANAKSVKTSDKHEVVKDQPPVLEFEAVKTITYYVEADVSISTLLSAQTVLLKKLTASEMEEVTGKAFLSNSTRFDWKLSLALTLLLAILIGAVRRFDLVRHIKYIFYAESKKKPLHGIQTIINDGHAHLDAGDLERAMMRYKEAKLSYERLNPYAQNEVLPDILRLHEYLDDAYFRKLLNRIGEAIDAGRIADAIEDYARLEGTFEHLPPEKQNDLIMIVNEIARKLHLGGEAA